MTEQASQTDGTVIFKDVPLGGDGPLWSTGVYLKCGDLPPLWSAATCRSPGTLNPAYEAASSRRGQKRRQAGALQREARFKSAS